MVKINRPPRRCGRTKTMALCSAAGAALVAAFALPGTTLAQKPAKVEGAGWTGLTNPKDVIEARESLMLAVERLMEPIDQLEVEPQDPATVKAAAARISEILPALPHLFPPTTNLYDPKAQIPETLALPLIWENFTHFYELAAAAAASAKKLAEIETNDQEELHEAGEALRGTCDACHAVYERPYVPSKVSEQDLNFDFDSVLPGSGKSTKK